MRNMCHLFYQDQKGLNPNTDIFCCGFKMFNLMTTDVGWSSKLCPQILLQIFFSQIVRRMLLGEKESSIWKQLRTVAEDIVVFIYIELQVQTDSSVLNYSIETLCYTRIATSSRHAFGLGCIYPKIVENYTWCAFQS